MDQPITEQDLQAFVDGQLDPLRRVAVEAYLQDHPAVAAEVMEDLKQRDALRRFLDEPVGEPAEPVLPTEALVRQLDGRLLRRRIAVRLRHAASAAMLVGFGWFAHAALGSFAVDPVAAAYR